MAAAATRKDHCSKLHLEEFAVGEMTFVIGNGAA